jgi:hypothetical protein
VAHRLELKIVARWVFEKHGPLLSWHSLKSESRRDDELDILFREALSKRVEFIFF